MKERTASVTFNHGYLCQMLRAANDLDLAMVIDDVKKEQKRRNEERRTEYANNILNAIKEAIEAGYTVTFYSDGYSKDEYDYCIHSNNLFLTNVSVEEEEDE